MEVLDTTVWLLNIYSECRVQKENNEQFQIKGFSYALSHTVSAIDPWIISDWAQIFFSQNFLPSGGIENSQIIPLLTVNSIRCWEFKSLALATRCPATASWYLHEWEVKASLEFG